MARRNRKDTAFKDKMLERFRQTEASRLLVAILLVAVAREQPTSFRTIIWRCAFWAGTAFPLASPGGR